MKVCDICGRSLPITNFSKKGKKGRRSYCKSCKLIRDEMLKVKQIDIPVLEKAEEVEVRGKKSNGNSYSYFVSFEKANQMVKERVCYIVNGRLIRKFFDRKTFRDLVFKKFGAKCFYCDEAANTIDHVIPKSKGGLSSFSNCVPACKKCNATKSSLDMDDFLYYFDLSPKIPGITQIEYTRIHLMELTEKLDDLKAYLNLCLKTIETKETNFNGMKELNKLEEKISEITNTIMEYKNKSQDDQKGKNAYRDSSTNDVIRELVSIFETNRVTHRVRF